MKAYIAIFAVAVMSSYAIASAESANVEASGYIVSYNNSTYMGLWAATADLEVGKGDLISVFKNGDGDIFVVTVKGEGLEVYEDGIAIEGKGIVAKNGALLREGDGIATINDDTVEIKVNGDTAISGKTGSFEVN